MKKTTVTLLILLINLFIAFLGIGLVIPVLPTLMNELHISGKVVGYMVAVFAIAQLVVSPLAGRWADTFGRKRMIVIGLFIFSLSELLFGMGQSLLVLFISRMLGGISAAFIMPAVTAFIADITTTEMRAKALGYMSAAISTGFIIGPGIGGFLADFGTRVPFFFAAGLACFAGLFSMVLLREPERHVQDAIEGPKQSGLRKIFIPMYFIAFMVILISSFGLASFESIFSLFVDHKFQFTPKDIAIIITGGGLVGAIAQVALFDRLTKYMGEIRVIFVSLLFSAVLVYFMTIVHSYYSILFVTMIVFVGFDLIRPAVTSYLSKIAGNDQGFVGGMNSMFTSIGNIFGPIMGGALFDINLDYPFYAGAIFLALGLVLVLFWKQPKESL
ncbi:multidrug resistance protein 1 [Sporosarcina sp. NCCP-2222]|uniref:MFS transporter n=1 Tax=Sporosarcina sp. NCCP-2222 TaxID=2935073 RepID=UPI00208B5694|nr:MFS transporter [Sporosarcina sp. NCCP-2222]GKV56391.1 multidrug resistance protein 1 [Sporosarcina sp. NCCP-2222]